MKKVTKGKYQIKAVKMHKGRDGYGMNANLYFENKKIATAYDAGDGGEMSVDFSNKQERADLVAFILREHKDNKDIDTDFKESIEYLFYAEGSAICDFVKLLSYEFQNIRLVKKDRNKCVYFGLKTDESIYVPQLKSINAPYGEKALKYLSDTYGDAVEYIGNEVFDIYPDAYTPKEKQGNK